MFRTVLGHYIEISLFGDLLGDESNHLGRACQVVGQDEVADKEALYSDAFLVDG